MDNHHLTPVYQAAVKRHRQTESRDATRCLMRRCRHYGVAWPGPSQSVISSVFVPDNVGDVA